MKVLLFVAGVGVALFSAACGSGTVPSIHGSSDLIGCETEADCDGNAGCVDQVCVSIPVDEVKVTDNSVHPNEAYDGAPNLGCIGGQIEAPVGPATATVYGIVDRFGGGRTTVGIEVAFFEAKSWPPAECTALPVPDQRECFRSQVSPWTTISIDPEEGVDAAQLPSQCEKHKDCPAGYECTEVDVEYHCVPQFGRYEVSAVPTNTWLVIRSRNGPQNANFDSKWKDTYVGGVYIYADRVDAQGRYNYNALMVSDSQWNTVPNTLFVQGGIKLNNGAVGGRIRDCRSAERDSFTLGEAIVGLRIPGKATGFFNDDEENTVPIHKRKATDIFGRFAIVDIPSGSNRIASSILVNGEVHSLGSEDIYVVPDSLYVVSFPGKQAILSK
jgi:hypothetical protein